MAFLASCGCVTVCFSPELQQQMRLNVPSFQLVCFWPGLAASWYRGVVQSLAIAIAFAWMVCVLLLATFVWPEWIGTWLLRGLWLVAFGIWSGGTMWNHMQLKHLLSDSSGSLTEEFMDAQEAYLRGDWFEAEAILLEIIEKSPRDAEAVLLLVGVLRHTKRWHPALRRLQQLELIENATPWRFEIIRERQFIEAALADEGQAEASISTAGDLPQSEMESDGEEFEEDNGEYEEALEPQTGPEAQQDHEVDRDLDSAAPHSEETVLTQETGRNTILSDEADLEQLALNRSLNGSQ